MTYVAAGEVTTLKHELRDDAVEGGALVVEGLAGAASALLAGAERAEVLSSLWLWSAIVRRMLMAGVAARVKRILYLGNLVREELHDLREGYGVSICRSHNSPGSSTYDTAGWGASDT